MAMFSPAVMHRVLAWCPSLCWGWSGGAEYAKTPAYSMSGCEGVHWWLWPWTDRPGGWLKRRAQWLLRLPHLCSLEHGSAHINGGPGIRLSAQCMSVCIHHTGCYRLHPSCGSSGQGHWVHQLLLQCLEGVKGDQWSQHPTKYNPQNCKVLKEECFLISLIPAGDVMIDFISSC